MRRAVCPRCQNALPHVHLDARAGDSGAIPVPIVSRDKGTTSYPAESVPELVREVPTRALNAIVDSKLTMDEEDNK